MRRVQTRIIAGIALLALACAAVNAAPEPTVESVRWNYAGNWVDRSMNLVTVVLVNKGDKPFAGLATLVCTGFGIQHLGLPQAALVGLAPGGRRIVQFYVSGFGDTADFTLRVGKNSHEFFAPELVPGEAAYLAPSGYRRSLPGMKSFPAEWFPPTVAGTDALRVAVLDHVPGWSPGQFQALLDWVYAGGVLVLTLGQDERMPVFPAALTPLNDLSASFNLGGGKVVRIERSTEMLTPEALVAHGVALPASEEALDDYEDEIVDWQTAQAYYDRTAEMFAQLRAAVAPDHNWQAMAWVLVGFTALVSIVNFRVARRWGVLAGISFFLVVLTGASWWLSIIGRRGYGEDASTDTIAVARALPGGRWDVTHFSNLFATSSLTRELHAIGEFDVFVAPGDESVDGGSASGADGKAWIRMPLYSHCSLLHRTQIAADGPSVRVLEWPSDTGLSGLRLAVEMPPDSVAGGEEEKLDVRVFRGSVQSGMRCRHSASYDEYTPIWEDPVEQYLREITGGYGFYYTYSRSRDHAWSTAWLLAYQSAVARVCPLRGRKDDDVLEVFLERRRLPDQMKLEPHESRYEDGRVLYHVRLRKPEELADD